MQASEVEAGAEVDPMCTRAAPLDFTDADIPDIPSIKDVTKEERQSIMSQRRRMKEKLREQNRPSRNRIGEERKRPTTADDSARRARQRTSNKASVATNAYEAEPVGEVKMVVPPLVANEMNWSGHARAQKALHGPEQLCLADLVRDVQYNRTHPLADMSGRNMCSPMEMQKWAVDRTDFWCCSCGAIPNDYRWITCSGCDVPRVDAEVSFASFAASFPNGGRIPLSQAMRYPY